MNFWFDVWDQQSGNLVNSFDTLSGALDSLKRSYRPELASWFESLVVTKEFDSDDDPQVILSGSKILVEIGAMPRMKSA